MSKIAPCLWFNGEAEEAAKFYISIFPESEITAISLSIHAKDAAEVDRLWNALTVNGGAESQCGWLKDRFGVSWQVAPDGLGELMCDPDPARKRRIVQAMMKMKKLDLAAMRAAAEGA